MKAENLFFNMMSKLHQNLKAVALKLRPWLIKMYEKMEVKDYSNRRISNQLKHVKDFWQTHGFQAKNTI